MRYSKIIKYALSAVVSYLVAIFLIAAYTALLLMAAFRDLANADDGRLASSSTGSARIQLTIQPVVEILPNAETQTESQKIFTNLLSADFTLETVAAEGFRPVLVIRPNAD